MVWDESLVGNGGDVTVFVSLCAGGNGAVWNLASGLGSTAGRYVSFEFELC